ncbi:MAG: hypoxanthine phosphoribosyltransferase [Candidatus Omnitrophota bacterium]
MFNEKYETVKKLISKAEINKKVTELAEIISRDYKNKQPFFICMLKGGWVFSADLIRKVTIPVLIDFLGVSSYGDKTESTGKIDIKSDLSTSVKDKDVLIIEDIVDSGFTLSKIKEYLLAQKPASLKICTLLDKPSRRKVKVKLDYAGFEIPDKFVVGYGIDYANKYRQLPYIGFVEFKENKKDQAENKLQLTGIR